MRYGIKEVCKESMMRNGIVSVSLFAFCLLSPVFAATSFSIEKRSVSVAAVLSGDEFMGRFNLPAGLFFDETKKRLYVADSGNSRLVSFDSEFKYLAELSDEKIILPMSLVRNKEGQFFVLDGEKSGVMLIDLEKKEITPLIVKDMPSGPQIFIPGRIAIDEQGMLYIIDKLNKRLVVTDKTGTFLREITVRDKGFFGFTDVRVDERGDVYAIDTIGGVVYVFDNKGEVVSKFGSRDAEKGIFRFPISLAVDKGGLIYVVDQHAGKILIFDKKGTFQYAISQRGVKEGELSSPSYIYIDSEGTIYIIDGNRVQIFKKEERE